MTNELTYNFKIYRSASQTIRIKLIDMNLYCVFHVSYSVAPFNSIVAKCPKIAMLHSVHSTGDVWGNVSMLISPHIITCGVVQWKFYRIYSDGWLAVAALGSTVGHHATGELYCNPSQGGDI